MDSFEKAKAARRMIDIKMPGEWERIKEWIEVTTAMEDPCLPAVGRFRLVEGEYVKEGEVLVELRVGGYVGRHLGSLVAPVSGVIREYHFDENGSEEKICKDTPTSGYSFVVCPGKPLVTIETSDIVQHDPRKLSRKLVSKLVSGCRPKKWERTFDQFFWLACATLLFVLFSVGIVDAIGFSYWFSFLALAWVVLVPAYLLCILVCIHNLSRISALKPDRIFK